MSAERHGFALHGPMHGERTHRWQKLTDGNSRAHPDPEQTIITIYTVPTDGPRLYVELVVDGMVARAHLTVEEAAGLAEAAREFVDAWA